VDNLKDMRRRLCGRDFRKAVQAFAELRHLDPGTGAALVTDIDEVDAQRAFQLAVARLVVQGGVLRLAAHWSELPSAEWREKLAMEISQQLPRWVDAGTLDLLLAVLNDPDSAVARRALSPLLFCLNERSDQERRQMAKTHSGMAALEAADQMAAFVTPEHRARISGTVTAALARHADNPKDLMWADDYIELLGLTASRRDQRSITLLEGFRAKAGATRRSEFERLDPANLPWPTSELARRKGIPPGTPFVRVHSIPTGLLDLEKLETAIERIRRRGQ